MKHSFYGSQRGFSLVEVMAGLLIGLISTIVIYQVLAVSEGYRRSSTGSGEGLQSGSVALYLLERELKQAGAGLDVNRFGDAIAVNENGRVVNGVVLAPVVITPGAGNAADTIRVFYGAAVQNGDLKQLVSPGQSAPGDPLIVTSPFGMNSGDIFVVAAPGLPGVMGHVTGIAGSSIAHANTAVNGLNFNAGGFPQAFPAGSVVMNLGQSSQGREPALNDYTVNANNQLIQTRFLVSSTPDAVADDIVTLKAQYGIDTNGDDIVDAYQNTLPAGLGFAAVRAIRVALLVRINAFEKQAVSPASIVLWPDSTATPTTTGPVIGLTGTDRNYRYRIFSTIVPLRNVIWPTTRVP